MSDEPFLSAGDLVTHNLIEWQEAVALVQAVCDRLAGGGVPELDQIGLLSTGDVVVRPVAVSTGPTTKRLGDTLVALLQGTNAPAPLRLFASQVTAASPLYSSLDDFSRGLAYFGRPDRSRLLQETYQRAMPALAVRALASTAPQSGQRNATSSDKPRRQGPTTGQTRLIAAAFAIAAVVTASFALRGRVDSYDIGTKSSKLLSRAKASAVAVVHAGVSSGTDLLRKVGLASAPRVVPPPDTPIQPRPVRRVPERAGIGSEGAAAPSSSLPSAASSPTGSGELSVDRSASAPANGDVTSARQQGTVTDQAQVDPRIYTADDADVSVPILSSQQLPTVRPETSTDSGVDGVAGVPGVIVELLINEKGAVDSVKFVTPPTDVRQRMLISVLKAWRYQPALKDGRPVRFLQRVRLTS